MILSLSEEHFLEYTVKQLDNLFPDNDMVRAGDIADGFKDALKRVDFCFSHVSLPHYFDGENTRLNHLFGDQYMILIWFLANALYKRHGKNKVSDKLYLLNKALFSLDCMYDTALPDIFLVFHGAGTMLGKASYQDFFVVLQGCTVGSHKGNYPVMGKGVSLTANSSVIGNCHLGDRVTISTRVALFEKDADAGSTIFMDWDKGGLMVKKTSQCYAQQFFNVKL